MAAARFHGRVTEDAGLRTDWSDAMGLRVPIVNAPMGGVAGAGSRSRSRPPGDWA